MKCVRFWTIRRNKWKWRKFQRSWFQFLSSCTEWFLFVIWQWHCHWHWLSLRLWAQFYFFFCFIFCKNIKIAPDTTLLLYHMWNCDTRQIGIFRFVSHLYPLINSFQTLRQKRINSGAIIAQCAQCIIHNYFAWQMNLKLRWQSQV